MAEAGTPAVIQAKDIPDHLAALHHMGVVSRQALTPPIVLLLSVAVIHPLSQNPARAFQPELKMDMHSTMTSTQAPINIHIAG